MLQPAQGRGREQTLLAGALFFALAAALYLLGAPPPNAREYALAVGGLLASASLGLSVISAGSVGDLSRATLLSHLCAGLALGPLVGLCLPVLAEMTATWPVQLNVPEAPGPALFLGFVGSTIVWRLAAPRRIAPRSFLFELPGVP